MKEQKGSITIAAAMATMGVAFLAIALAGCSTRRGVTEGHDKACFYSADGIKAESDQIAGIIRTSKEDAKRKSTFLEYRETQNQADLLKARIKGFWGNMTAPQEK